VGAAIDFLIRSTEARHDLTHPSLVPVAGSRLAPAVAVAHHGWGGYDTSKSFTVTGKILKSTFENPHCEIEMEVDGKLWHFVLAPPRACRRVALRLT
jgi:hypothetical protein